MKLGSIVIFETLKTMMTTIFNKIHIWGLKMAFLHVGIYQRNISVFSGSTLVKRGD